MQVLDLGAGSGSTALLAAGRAEEVTAMDLTDDLFGICQQRAAAAGVTVIWVAVNPEDLPFSTGHFDRVLSAVGGPLAMAPNQRRVAASSGRDGAGVTADHLARRGNASPVHVHHRDDETFFVLDGELRVFAGDEEHIAGPGTVAVLPRRLRHAYVVTSATRFLTLHTPSGFEQFAAEVGEPARALTLPPPPAGPPDFAALAQAAARHQITILAPLPQP
jgi:mannose-6-phosphate isomerase-like protein (cupin superfamily)